MLWSVSGKRISGSRLEDPETVFGDVDHGATSDEIPSWISPTCARRRRVIDLLGLEVLHKVVPLGVSAITIAAQLEGHL